MCSYQNSNLIIKTRGLLYNDKFNKVGTKSSVCACLYIRCAATTLWRNMRQNKKIYVWRSPNFTAISAWTSYEPEKLPKKVSKQSFLFMLRNKKFAGDAS